MAEAEQPTRPERPPPQDSIVVTQHRLQIGGEEIAYTVTCGTLVLKEEALQQGEKAGVSDGEQPRATIFFIAYTRDGVADPASRPLTFSFNGGPGSASVWLHLGVLGPERVLMSDDGAPLPPPYRLVPNEYSLLPTTDLVFIDPVSTGYSRAVTGEKAGQFHGFKKDIESVGDFIRLYTTRYRRWLSPKYLIGESYGTTRAGGLAGYLQDRHGFFLNGIMLISSILNFQTVDAGPGNDLPYLLYLPTYTATAWYHKKLPADLQNTVLNSALAEAEAFVMGEYTLALMQGDHLPDEQRQLIGAKLARLTGLSEAYIARTDLRVEIMRFCKELLREQRRTVGRLDSRFIGVDRDGAGEHFEYDASFSNIMGPYTATLYDYVRGKLGFESDLPYEVISERVYPWSFAQHENRYVDVAETLRKAMSENPFLRIYVASGYYDLATPYFATEYTFAHLGLHPDLRKNIRFGYYEAGHMMYIHLPSLAKLRDELVEFMA
jgi:carboxypeptidase C (cathepsin A)